MSAFESNSSVRIRPGHPWLLALCLTVGMAAASYMTFESLQYLQIGNTGHRLCSFSKWINCDASVSSPYAFVLGVPIAWVALLYFVSLACLLGVAKWLPRQAPALLAATVVLSIAGASISVFMLAVLVLKIKAICLPCLLIQCACYGLCAILVGTLRGPEKNMSWSSAIVPLATVQAFYGGGVAALLSFQTEFLEPKPVNVAREVQQYLSEPVLLDSAALPPAMGKEADGKVQIVCFIDFQCPECRRMSSLLPGWLGNLKEKCQITHLQFPLDPSVNPYKPNGRHTQAGLAAEAAICFQQLGVSETLERRMFRFQNTLSLATILTLAASASINTNSLVAMMQSSETQKTLARHIEVAHKVGVSATPSLFIDGRGVALYYEPEVLRGIVKSELNRRETPGTLGIRDH
jgi:protein-disulfide isomerase